MLIYTNFRQRYKLCSQKLFLKCDYLDQFSIYYYNKNNDAMFNTYIVKLLIIEKKIVFV